MKKSKSPSKINWPLTVLLSIPLNKSAWSWGVKRDAFMWQLCAAMMSWVGCLITDSGLPGTYMKVKRIGIKEILRRIWLFSATKIKCSESDSKQPTQLIVELNSSLRHIIVTKAMMQIDTFNWNSCIIVLQIICRPQLSRSVSSICGENNSHLKVYWTKTIPENWVSKENLFVLILTTGNIFF